MSINWITEPSDVNVVVGDDINVSAEVGGIETLTKPFKELFNDFQGSCQVVYENNGFRFEGGYNASETTSLKIPIKANRIKTTFLFSKDTVVTPMLYICGISITGYPDKLRYKIDNEYKYYYTDVESGAEYNVSIDIDFKNNFIEWKFYDVNMTLLHSDSGAIDSANGVTIPTDVDLRIITWTSGKWQRYYNYQTTIYNDDISYNLYDNNNNLIDTKTTTDTTYNYTKVSELTDNGNWKLTATNAGTTIESDFAVVVNAGGDYPTYKLDDKRIDYTSNISMAVKYSEITDGTIRAIDRGYLTDRYSVKIEFQGTHNEVVAERNYLRENLLLSLGKTSERIFGDHIENTNVDYTDIVVSDISDIENHTHNNSSFSFTLGIAEQPQIEQFVKLPNFNCLQSGYKINSTYNYITNSSYTNNQYVSDMKLDVALFEGEYYLTNLENAQLFSWWLTQVRGDTITINDGDFGVVDMFGDGAATHEVNILDISYKVVNPVLRVVKIIMRKAIKL